MLQALYLWGSISQKLRKRHGTEEILPEASLLSNGAREIISDATSALFTCFSWLPAPTSLLSTDQN